MKPSCPRESVCRNLLVFWPLKSSNQAMSLLSSSLRTNQRAVEFVAGLNRCKKEKKTI